MKPPDKIFVGLKFASIYFTDGAEVVAIREEENEIDIMLTSSEGFARIEKGWNLQHTKWAFEKGYYKPIEITGVNISVY